MPTAPRQKTTVPAATPIGVASQTVLIAVTGLSPAVLTETLWALAHDRIRPTIPDKVIVLTTLTGAQRMKDQLFGADELWLTLRRQLLGKNHATDLRLDFAETPDRLKVFTRKSGGKRMELDRMDTLEETESVGDCLVEEIWNWVGRPDTRVLSSISGGFKTMSALMYAAMSVLGAPEDRILHVLVDDPFDGGTKPLYYWPDQPTQALLTTRPSKAGPAGTMVKASLMKPVLTDVRFPALRKLFMDYGFKKPPSFAALVQRCQESVDTLAAHPIETLELEPATLEVRVNHQRVEVSPTQFYILLYLADCVKMGHEFEDAKALNADFLEFLQRLHSRATPSRKQFLAERLKVVAKEVRASGDPRFTKNLSDMRKKLERSGLPLSTALGRAVPSGKNRLLLHPDQIRIIE